MIAGAATAVVIAGFVLLERYVGAINHKRQISWSVQMLNPPRWVSKELRDHVCLKSSGIRVDDFLLDDNLTQKWAANLADNPWVKQVRMVRKRYDGLVEIDCELRRPIGSITQAGRQYYVDSEAVVIPALPLRGAEGHVVELEGVDLGAIRPGDSVGGESLQAGLAVLAMIREVDDQLPQAERLWGELAALDVSNYEGRLNPSEAHLKLYTTNNRTEVRWGAALGRARCFHEASDKSKLRQLYRKRRLYGTLERYRYVELRDVRLERTDPLRQG